MIMRTLVLIGALGLTALACAQDSTAVLSRWRIGVSGSFDLAYHSSVLSSTQATPTSIFDLEDEPKNTYSLGLDLRYDLARHWVLASGLQFTDRGFRIELTDFVATDTISVDPSIPESVLTTVHFQYISIPLMAHYTFGGNKVHYEPGAGVMTDFLHSFFSNVTTVYSDERKETDRFDSRDDIYRSVTLTACVELNVHLTLAERWELRVGPRARYQILSKSEWDVDDRLWEAGLLFGCFYRL